MEIGEYCDLLIVRANEALYVVESPNYEGEVDDLVEFDTKIELILGTVVDKMFVEKNGDAYRCIALLLPIRTPRKIYKVRWEAWEGNDEECGG